MYKYDFLVFVARAQPFHIGHYQVIKKALELSKTVIVVLGSDRRPLTVKNPFTTAERVKMIRAAFKGTGDLGRIEFASVLDYKYNDSKWIAGVQTAVFSIVNRRFNPDPVKIGLIGHSKDKTSFYLKIFPYWASEEVENYENINATEIRKGFFENDKSWMNSYQTEPMNRVLEEMRHIFEYQEDRFAHLQKEYAYYADYPLKWGKGPFVTVDSLVTQGGYILLIERKNFPGKGLLALPGGFIDVDETLDDATIRELREETGLKVPKSILRGSIKAKRIFDAPDRSLRGRIITQCTHFELTSSSPEKVKGGDDAAKAFWVPIDQVQSDNMFEDHFDMIQTMLGL